VLAEIDARIAQLDEQLKSLERLSGERERLRHARATLLGEAPLGQVSQEDIARYLREHPGARPGEIAKAFGISSNRVSAHLFRGKRSRFVSRSGGWYLREQPRRGGLR
jgi:DNA-directed RNA polymerase specialized sigma24 family protein